MSCLARSMPLVMNGKPGMMNSMAQIYPASWRGSTSKSSSAPFKHPAYTRHAAPTDSATHRKSVYLRLVSILRTLLPMPAPKKAKAISTGPPPNRNVKAPQARAAAIARRRVEYNPCRASISSRRMCRSSPESDPSLMENSSTKRSKRLSLAVFTPVEVRVKVCENPASPSKQVYSKLVSPMSAAQTRPSLAAMAFMELRTRQAPVPQARSISPVRPTTEALAVKEAVRMLCSPSCWT